jgi:phosphatidylglycerophosphatase A
MEQNQSEASLPGVKLSFIEKFFGSGFLTGYSPYASGTVGSAAALLFLLIPGFTNPYVIIPATLVVFGLGGFVADKMEKIYGQDPSIVTIDEVVGMWIALWFIPINYLSIGIAFLIFRILDILKPYPAGEIDKKSGGWNIMLDDVVAGMYANIIVQVALRINL